MTRRIVYVLIVIGMLLSACISIPEVTPLPVTQEECDASEKNMQDATKMAQNDKDFYIKTYNLRKEAEDLVSKTFGFQISDLEKSLPEFAVFTIPPAMTHQDCSFKVNLGYIEHSLKILEVAGQYIDAANIEIDVGTALLSITEQPTMSLNRYQNIIKEAIHDAKRENDIRRQSP